MKIQKNNVLNAQGKFSQSAGVSPSSVDLSQLDLTQLGEIIILLLNADNLKVRKVRPFFWSLVETYVDRFQIYPFDAEKALLNDLELKEYPEEAVLHLVQQLEEKFEKVHGRPLRKPAQLLSSLDTLDDEIKKLRDSLKYAAIVADSDN